MSLHTNNAKKNWGNDLPEWVLRLAKDCDQNSLSIVARKIGASNTYIQQAINKTSPSAVTTIEKLAQGYYLGRTVDCPALGEILANDCEHHQKRPFSTTNPQRVRLYKACRNGCQYSRLEK